VNANYPFAALWSSNFMNENKISLFSPMEIQNLSLKSIWKLFTFYIFSHRVRQGLLKPNTEYSKSFNVSFLFTKNIHLGPRWFPKSKLYSKLWHQIATDGWKFILKTNHDIFLHTLTSHCKHFIFITKTLIALFWTSFNKKQPNTLLHP